MKYKIQINTKKLIILTISILIILAYLLAGQLRFFINNYIPITFFAKDYLVILQNDTELRPSGGFITAYGRIKFVLGIPIIMDIKNSYEIEPQKYTTPPYPQKELLGSNTYQGYSFRDANWNASFPDNTNELLNFYYENNPRPIIDGIIVINYNLIEQFLKNLGEVKLGNRIVTNNNLFELLEYNVNNIDKHNIESLKDRKNIINDIGKKIIFKSILNPITAKNTIQTGLIQKDIFIWFKNPRLQKAIEKRNWANNLYQNNDSDFLSINLANLGSKKSDRYTYIEADHFVNLSSQEPTIELHVKIVNPISKNSYNDTYKGYLRIYIPNSATEITSNSDINIEYSGNTKSIGTIVNIEPQSNSEYTFKYKLPANLFSKNIYSTKLIKQSGSNIYFTSHIESQIGTSIKANQYNATENFAISKFELIEDRNIKIEIQKDQLPPVVEHQLFEDTNTIKIIWNEPINENDITNIYNYSLTDTNKKNPTKDNITIESIEFLMPNAIKIYTKGISTQPNEAYTLTIENISDVSGNRMNPNPYTITVMQRLNSINL